MKECGKTTQDMEKECTTIVMEKSIEEITTKDREMDLEYSTIKMETDMKDNGEMEILKGLEHITIALVKCTWESTKIIRDVEKEGTSIKMELYTMGIGRMEIKEELVVTSMEMESTWGSVT